MTLESHSSTLLHSQPNPGVTCLLPSFVWCHFRLRSRHRHRRTCTLEWFIKTAVTLTWQKKKKKKKGIVDSWPVSDASDALWRFHSHFYTPIVSDQLNKALSEALVFILSKQCYYQKRNSLLVFELLMGFKGFASVRRKDSFSVPRMNQMNLQGHFFWFFFNFTRERKMSWIDFIAAFDVSVNLFGGCSSRIT